jgi:hypothetical protein
MQVQLSEEHFASDLVSVFLKVFLHNLYLPHHTRLDHFGQTDHPQTLRWVNG